MSSNFVPRPETWNCASTLPRNIAAVFGILNRQRLLDVDIVGIEVRENCGGFSSITVPLPATLPLNTATLNDWMSSRLPVQSRRAALKSLKPAFAILPSATEALAVKSGGSRKWRRLRDGAASR